MATRWELDGQPVESPTGETILEAARRAGVDIPTLCWSDSCGGQARCMICAVEDQETARLIPACAAIPQAGMHILSASAKATAHRRNTLAWLLGEHRGDCLAPCQLACPAGLDVPGVLASFETGEEQRASEKLVGQLALAEVLGYLCEAPCERVCHRGRADESVAIRSFERLPMDSSSAELPERNGLRVVVVGGGVSGLATAEYLALCGTEVTVIEAANELGGRLLQAVSDAGLPQEVLHRALSRLQKLGVRSELGRAIRADQWAGLRAQFHAAVWATGSTGNDGGDDLLPGDALVGGDSGGRMRSDGWFVVGGALREGRSIAAHVGDGRRVSSLVAKQVLPIFHERFSTSILPMEREEWVPFLQGRSPEAHSQVDAEVSLPAVEKLVAEARRCLQCRCSALDSCGLRKLAIAEGVRPQRGGGRRRAGSRADHTALVFQSGKCIACGLCVAACSKWPEVPGLGWHGRGTMLTVSPPPGYTLEEAVGNHASELAQLCPTGALMIPAEQCGRS
jgi:hypothetical protein